MTAGLDYAYDVQASDPDGDPLHYALSSTVAGPTINDQGLVRWSPKIADIGTHTNTHTHTHTHLPGSLT